MRRIIQQLDIRHIILISACLLNMIAVQVCRSQSVTLTERKVPLAGIVLEAGSSAAEQTAAAELQTYVYKMSGANLPIEMKRSALAGKIPIYIGKNPAGKKGLLEQLSARKNDAFLIKTLPDAIYITGNNDPGTMYGVSRFLQELGVRWFMPGEYGEIIPHQETIIWNHSSIVEEADFHMRWIGNKVSDWSRRNFMNINIATESLPDIGYEVFGSFHTFKIMLDPDKYFRDHPEYYAQVSGRKRWDERTTSHRNQICTSNPEAGLACAYNFDRMLQDQPNLDVVTLGANDGKGFCECRHCLDLDEPSQPMTGSLSRRFMLFYNFVAERLHRSHPDVLVKVGAYSMYTRPPLDPGLEVAPNIIVQFTRATSSRSCYMHSLNDTNCSYNQIIRRNIIGWEKISRHLWIYEYYAKGAWIGFPWSIIHTIREDIPLFKNIGVEGFYTQYNFDPIFRSNHLYYIAAHLLWDVEADVDELMQDFFTRFYREAGEPMQRYWETLEKSLGGEAVCSTGQAVARAMKYFTPEILGRCERIISEAENAAQSAQIQERVLHARNKFDYTKMVMAYLRYFENLLDQNPGLRELTDEQYGVATKKSAVIRKYIETYFPGRLNSNYVKRMLKPEFSFNRVRTIDDIPFPFPD